MWFLSLIVLVHGQWEPSLSAAAAERHFQTQAECQALARKMLPHIPMIDGLKVHGKWACITSPDQAASAAYARF